MGRGGHSHRADLGHPAGYSDADGRTSWRAHGLAHLVATGQLHVRTQVAPADPPSDRSTAPGRPHLSLLTHRCLSELLLLTPLAEGRPESPPTPRPGGHPRGPELDWTSGPGNLPLRPRPLPAALEGLLPNMGLEGRPRPLARHVPGRTPALALCTLYPHGPQEATATPVGRGRAEGNWQFWERPQGSDQKARTGQLRSRTGLPRPLSLP